MKESRWTWGWTIPVLVVIVVTGAFYACFIAPARLDLNEVGDAFGALNTFFSGLAFALLITTLLMQRREMDLQRDVLYRSAQAHEDNVAAARSASEIALDQLRAATSARVIVSLHYTSGDPQKAEFWLQVSNEGPVSATGMSLVVSGEEVGEIKSFNRLLQAHPLFALKDLTLTPNQRLSIPLNKLSDTSRPWSVTAHYVARKGDEPGSETFWLHPEMLLFTRPMPA